MAEQVVRKSDPKEKEVIKKASENPIGFMRSIVKNSLFYFIQYFWETYSNDEFKPNWHIKKICTELEYIARRVANNQEKEYDLIINVPPGTTKTATVSIFFPVWCWVNWHWMKFITASHSHDLSLESAEYSRDIVRSELFRQMFFELDTKDDKDNKSNFRIIKKEYHKPGRAPKVKAGGNRLSTSVKGSATGYHGHILIWDDLIDPRRSISEVELKSANNFVDQTLSTRKTDKLTTPTIGIMQRLHQNDPTAHLLDKRKDIRHICLPGEIRTQKFKEQLRPKEWECHYIEGLLDPNRLSWSVLSNMQDELGQYGYSGQVGQNPVPPGGGMFKVDCFSYVDPTSFNFEANIVRTVRYWDKAGTEGGGAYTAGVKMSLLKNGKYLIQDVKKGQWSTEARERIIKNTAEADGVYVGIYHEQEPGSSGKDSAAATTKNLAGFFAQADRPTGDKVYRADPYSVQVNNGNVLLLQGEWNKDFIAEHQFFPHSTYKDQVDGASGAFTKLSKVKKAGGWGNSRK